MKRIVLFLLVFVLSVSVVAAQDSVTITVLVDDSQQSLLQTQALVDAFTAENPNITINIETRLQGTEGDNIVKTRLATGDMPDVFFYNSGSLLQALNPAQTLVDLSDQPFIDNVVESFLPTVSQGEGIYGVPVGTAMGGGILYNRRVYEELGLSVPLTWDEFVANNEVIAEAGLTPVIATFGDTWTSQLFVLGDYYNVAQALPDFAEQYTANEAKYATTPEAMAGFEYLQQGYELGWWQQDYATMRYEQGLELLANGEGVHFPMLMFAMTTIEANFPDQVNDIGFFGQPGTDPEVNGATVWMPGAAYIPQTTQGANLEAALGFLGFIASVEGTDAITSATPPAGPYLIEGSTLPDDVLPAVQDLAAYIDSGNSYPALEFVSPIKGPNLEQLCVAVATGQMSAEEAAANYDLDVERQAQQLGLPGW
jgi:raffinose/stachyose/melibiose transport system substrate-binding protein